MTHAERACVFEDLAHDPEHYSVCLTLLLSRTARKVTAMTTVDLKPKAVALNVNLQSSATVAGEVRHHRDRRLTPLLHTFPRALVIWDNSGTTRGRGQLGDGREDYWTLWRYLIAISERPHGPK